MTSAEGTGQAQRSPEAASSPRACPSLTWKSPSGRYTGSISSRRAGASKNPRVAYAKVTTVAAGPQDAESGKKSTISNLVIHDTLSSALDPPDVAGSTSLYTSVEDAPEAESVNSEYRPPYPAPPPRCWSISEDRSTRKNKGRTSTS